MPKLQDTERQKKFNKHKKTKKEILSRHPRALTNRVDRSNVM